MDVKKRIFLSQCIFFVIGLFFISLGINIMIVSNFGVGGWDAVNIALVNIFGFSIGVWLNIWAVGYLLLSACLEKKRPKIECIITSIILGFCIDGWNIVFHGIEIQQMGMQVLVFLLGIGVISLGAGIYLVSELPANPIDHLMLVIIKRFQTSITTAKYLVEGTGMLLGTLLGGPVGLGTILMLIIFGPMIQFFTKRSKHVLLYIQQKIT